MSNTLSLYNKVANDILLEVKPVKLRKQLIPKVLELVDDEYQRGFSEGCEYVTKIEELAFINENLQKQLTELQTEYNYILNQLLEARKPSKKKKTAVESVAPGQLTMFDSGEIE